jgi:hypothetical protein
MYRNYLHVKNIIGEETCDSSQKREKLDFNAGVGAEHSSTKINVLGAVL